MAKATALGAKVVMERTSIDQTSAFAVSEDADCNHVGLYEGVTGGEDAE